MSPSPMTNTEVRYRRLFEAAYDGILIIDPGTRKVIDVNPFLVAFLGYSREEFLGRELFELGLLKDEAASQSAFRELQNRGYIRYEDLPLETKSGQRVDVEFISNLYQEGDHQVIQCNVRDITARKQIENALRETDLRLAKQAADLDRLVGVRTTELRLANEQLETFVYSIAHDLRAPLRTMQGYAQLLVQEHAMNLNEEGRQFANFISSAAQTMDLLLADLLTFSRVSQQKIELVSVSLKSVVQEAIGACEQQIRDGHACVENIAPWPMVTAHAATIGQVLVNLLGNALKFVADKAPHVRLYCEERPGQVVRVWIEDNGIGIPAEFQQRIFQVFQRLHTTKYAGTGIGLAIVHKGMERLGGHVGVVSAPGQGSRFWIELPKAPDDHEDHSSGRHP